MKWLSSVTVTWLALMMTMLPGWTAVEVNINPQPIPTVNVNVVHPDSRPTVPVESQIRVSYTSTSPHHLFRVGQPISMTVSLFNPGESQTATVHHRVSTSFGMPIQQREETVTLPAQERLVLSLPLVTPDAPWPNGPYRVETLVTTRDNMGTGATMLGIWSGPTDVKSTVGGISLTGPLSVNSLDADLALLAQAGVQWVRFPLQGWLPQAGVTPQEVADYQAVFQLMQQHGMSPVVAFSPRTTVDPSVNAAQAEQEYIDSFSAAVTQYRSAVKWWNLLTVKPDPAYPEMRGIGYSVLAKGRKALSTLDKDAHVIYGVDAPYKWNAAELYHHKIPARGDTVGMQYHFVGIPELQVNPTPPLYDAERVRADASSALKRTPPLWVTEYGFQAERMTRYAYADTHAAALLSRALILNAAADIDRTFWRHDTRHGNLEAFVGADGSVQPSLLALSTTLRQLDGLTSIQAVTGAPAKMYLLKYNESGKGRRRKAARYGLVAWNESGPMTITMKTSAPRLEVVDIWGNAIDLSPVSGTALLYLDASPRFIDLGTTEKFELLGGFARFEPARALTRPDGENSMRLDMFNDTRLFGGNVLTCELHFRRWPLNTDVRTQRVSIDPQGRQSLEARLEVPSDAVRGLLYDVSVDIMVGTRRIGYLLLPVWYTPNSPTATPASEELLMP